MRLALLFALIFPALPLVAQTTAPADQPLKPDLKFPTALSYEKEIGEPAVVLESDHLWLFAPKRKNKEAALPKEGRPPLTDVGSEP